MTWARDWLDDAPTSVPWLRRMIIGLFALQALAFLARGADRPADPFLKARPPVTVAPAAPAPSTTVAPGLPGG